MMDLNINPQKLYNEIVKVINEDDGFSGENKNSQTGFGSYNSTNTLNQFGTDLTKLAKEGKLDPVIGREDEIERVIQILSRRTKNNPCLIGEPGVGKTAVVEGLAQKIIDEDVPEMLKNKRVVSVDISSMVAGAKYREENMKMSENNDYIQLPPLKKDTPSDVVAFMWKYMKVPENSREKVKNLLKDANENGVKLSHQAPTLYDVVPKMEIK